MVRLDRFTTDYVATEDRICLLARDRDETTVQRIWLTARLLRRLVPALVEGIEHPAPDDVPRERAVQRFAQQAARAAQPRLPAVKVPAEPGGALGEWVARIVHMSRTPQATTLTFKSADSEDAQSAVLVLSPQLQRQWLNILHDQWLRAGWPPDLWPAWMREGAAPPQRSPASPVH